MSSRGWTYVLSGVVGAVSVGAQVLCSILLDKQAEKCCNDIQSATDEACLRIGSAYKERKEEVLKDHQ